MPLAITRSRFTRSQIAWIVALTLIAVTLNPFLKSIGLLPRDVFVSLGVKYPGLPQIVFGPVIAFLLLVCFIKTGEPLIFPGIGILRALSLGFVFPANLDHLGTGLAGILAGFIAAALVKNTHRVNMAVWLPLLAGLYAGFYAAGNYLTTLIFGKAAETQIIVSDWRTIAVIAGSLVIGLGFGAIGQRLFRWSPAPAPAAAAE
jgi:hypothetical protein